MYIFLTRVSCVRIEGGTMLVGIVCPMTAVAPSMRTTLASFFDEKGTQNGKNKKYSTTIKLRY